MFFFDSILVCGVCGVKWSFEYYGQNIVDASNGQVYHVIRLRIHRANFGSCTCSLMYRHRFFEVNVSCHQTLI